MPRWDPDRELVPYEPIAAPGTQFVRILMGVDLARSHGLKVPRHYTLQSISVWSLAIGQVQQEKHVVYGLTMRECFLRLRKQAKQGLKLGSQFPITWQKKKK